MIIQVFSAFWAVAMFSILTETPKKFLPYAAFSGGFAWWAYLMINNLTHSTLQAAFFSILAVAFLSHILARIMKAPVTVFLIAGILPSVPGAGIYRTVYYLIQDTFNPLPNLDASHGRRDRPGDLYHRFGCQPCASLS